MTTHREAMTIGQAIDVGQRYLDSETGLRPRNFPSALHVLLRAARMLNAATAPSARVVVDRPALVRTLEDHVWEIYPGDQLTQQAESLADAALVELRRQGVIS